MLLAIAGLAAASTAAARAPAQDRGEQFTPPLSQPARSSRAAIQANMDQLAKSTSQVILAPVSSDTDASLAEKLIGLENLEIDLTQNVLTFSVDPELRQLVSQNLNFSASAIAELKSWQTGREILQRQLRTPEVK